MAMDELAALGDQTRRTIVNKLRMGPKSVSEITKAMKVSRPAVSQGLKILLDAELVKQERHGRNVYYRLERRGMERLRDYVDGLLDVIERYGKKKVGEQNR
jgi:DNA-binding transcriptional ArsR family regulator